MGVLWAPSEKRTIVVDNFFFPKIIMITVSRPGNPACQHPSISIRWFFFFFWLSFPGLRVRERSEGCLRHPVPGLPHPGARDSLT